MLSVAVAPHPSARLCPSAEAARRRHELRAASAAAREREATSRAAGNDRLRAASVDDSPSHRAAAHSATIEAERKRRQQVNAQQEAWEAAARKKLEAATDAREQWVGMRAKQPQDPTECANAAEEKLTRERDARRRKQQEEHQRQSADANRQQSAELRRSQLLAARKRNAGRFNARVARVSAARDEWDAQVVSSGELNPIEVIPSLLSCRCHAYRRSLHTHRHRTPVQPGPGRMNAARSYRKCLQRSTRQSMGKNRRQLARSLCKNVL